jgi:hypothetical protein
MFIFPRDAELFHTARGIDGRLGGTSNLVTQKVSCVPGSVFMSATVQRQGWSRVRQGCCQGWE